MSDQKTALLELVDEHGQIDPEISFVVVENLNDYEFDFMYNSRHWKIKPGDQRTIPYFNMVYYCGDPRSYDDPRDSRLKFRSDEWNRLRTLYGVYENTSSDVHMSQMPKFNVTTQSGIPITTVLQDPEGKSLEGDIVQRSDLESMKDDIARMTAVLDAKLKLLDDKQKEMADLLPDNMHRTEEPLVTPAVASRDIPTEIPVTTAEDLVSPTTKIQTKKAVKTV